MCSNILAVHVILNNFIITLVFLESASGLLLSFFSSLFFLNSFFGVFVDRTSAQNLC